MKDHYEDAAIMDLVWGKLDAADAATIEQHIERCDACRNVYLDFQSFRRGMIRERSVAKFVARATRIMEERERLPAMLRELRALDVSSWPRWFGSHPADATFEAVRAVVDHAKSTVERSPRIALDMLYVAERVADGLHDADDRASALAESRNQIATALRLLGHLPEALDTLDRAETAIEARTVVFDERARINWNRASVLFAMERRREALTFLEQARAWFADVGDEKSLALIGILEGAILNDDGDFAAAAETFRRIAPFLERQQDWPNLARIYSNLAFVELSLGHSEAAASYGSKSFALFAEHGMLTERTRTRWMFARKLHASGDVDQSLTALAETAAEFEALGMVLEAAQVEVERIEILIGKGEWSDALAIAERVVVVCQRAGARVSHVQAAESIREAVRATEATRDLLQTVRAYFSSNGEGRFPPPAVH